MSMVMLEEKLVGRFHIHQGLYFALIQIAHNLIHIIQQMDCGFVVIDI